jgi:hypothetical protein
LSKSYKDTFWKFKSPLIVEKENMEKHDMAYYINQRVISAGLGLPYNMEHHILQDDINRKYYEDKYNYIKKQEEIKNKTKYIFLTINPNAQVDFKEFFRVIVKMMSKNWITNYLWVIEQRGETLDELGKGFHFHAIIEKPANKAYAHMVRELSNSANRVCDTSNFHFFNLKNISEEEKERKIVYITGSKADEAKHKKQELDIVFRKNNNLLSYYNIGII